jgi:glycerol-1-phosphate dehydrogenase [NAD(P)+]
MELSTCLGRHGLPRSHRDLGLSDEQFVQAVAYAPSTRPDRFTILEHLDLDEEAILDHAGSYAEAVAG